MVPSMNNYLVWSPAVNIYETEDALLVIAEVAGVSPEEIYIKYEGNRLLVWGQRREPNLDAIRAVHRMEIQMGTFAFVIDLRGSVSAEGSEAELEAGMLQIRLPKRTTAEGGMIPVRHGHGKENKTTEEQNHGHE
jgi:HSP20 family protein